MDAFEADVLIYAAVTGHGLGRRVRALFTDGSLLEGAGPARIGSTLLIPALLTEPARDGADDELLSLASSLGRIELLPTDRATAELATSLGAIYGLRAADAIHLATAVGAGADRFITNNSSDFPRSIVEVTVTYPGDLPDPWS
jgi:predicted nucleic acid-binding protein